MNKLLSLITCMLLFLSGCGWNDTPTRNNDFTELTSIEITAVSSKIAEHTSTKLSAKGNFSGYFTRDITDQVVWASNSPAVAAFKSKDDPSRISGISQGNAVISATLGKVSSNINMTISSAKVTAIEITPVVPSIAMGLSTQYAATGTFSDETTQDLTFDVLWETDAADVVSFSDPIKKGLATAITNGSAKITATLDAVSGETNLKVTDAVLQSISLPSTELNMVSGETSNLTAKATFSDSTTKDVTAYATWKSNDSAVATVGDETSNKGKITAISTTGNATITATYGGKSASVTVKILTVQSLTLSTATSTTIAVGDSTVFKLTAIYSDNSSIDVTSNASTSWTSSSTQIAELLNGGAPGEVKAKAAGTTTLTASYGGKTATVLITVP